MVQRGLLVAAMVMASLSLGTTFAGESGDMRAVMERLQKLEADNAKLKAELHGRSSVRGDVDRAISRSTSTMDAVVSGTDAQCRPLVMHGYFDVSYQWNVAGPDNQNNNQRVFDRDSQGFNVHAAEIDFDRLPTKGGEAGFRLDLAYGTDSAKYQSSSNNPTFSNNFSESGASFSSGSDIVNLQQAYLSYIANIGNGVTIDMGKFVTWSGAEVIESADNINASRSILFGAQPVTHTGIRGSYQVLSERCGHKWTLGLSIQNGWDNVQDQNDSKTLGLMSNLQVTKWFNWVVSAYAGNESFADERSRFANSVLAGDITFDSTEGSFLFPDNTGVAGVGSAATGRIWDSGDSGDARLLLDTVLTFTPWEDLTFQAEGMYINDEPGVQWGVAGYVKWQFAKNWYIANRTEYFNDRDGVHFGVRQCTWESTLTLDWKLSDPLHLRFEFRHDESNRDVYSSTKGVNNGGVNVFHPFRNESQDTFMMQWVYKF